MDFGISGAPWEAILAPRDHPGGPWEQQDGHEVVNDKNFVDFVIILGLVYVSFWSAKCFKIHCFVGLCPGHFFIDF